MSVVKEELLSVIDKFSGVPMLVVGDLILDRYIWGRVSRVSQEAPVVIVDVTEEGRRPGGAGNVARNLASLGAKVSVSGVIGDDGSGKDLLQALEEIGAETAGVFVDSSRPTTVKTRVIAHAQQVVRVDREQAQAIPSALSEGLTSYTERVLDKVSGVVVSDYAKGVVTRRLFEMFDQEKARGLTGLGKIPVVVDPKPPNNTIYSGATVMKPNRREAESASGRSIKSRGDAIAASDVLLERWNPELLLITVGSNGMVLVSNTADNRGGLEKSVVEIPTMAQEVFDVSGAGDTVNAVLSLSLSVGARPEAAARLANYAAGIAVAEVGVVSVSADELRAAIEIGEIS